jgi:chitin disaccharide deacetylase
VTERLLIVNADDFGRSACINEGVIETYERGIVTSASLMVGWPASEEAAAYARANTGLSLGLHLDIGEWAYREDGWVQLYGVEGDLQAEVARQLARFRELAGRDPTHLDSHQHVHREEPLRPIMLGLARELQVPLREFSERVRYCGDFFGQAAKGRPYPEGITVDRLLRIVASLRSGVTELGCHPGLDCDLESGYRDERLREVEALCDPRVPITLGSEHVELRSFASLPN